jgi:nitrile hydratase subunit beta
MSRQELERFAKGSFPLSRPSADGRLNAMPRTTFAIGDRVRVKNEFGSGHVRMPGYIRGKTGVVVGESPPYPFPDAAAHNLQGQDEPTYDVRFRTEDLWPQAAEEATVHVAVFQSYLEKAP